MSIGLYNQPCMCRETAKEIIRRIQNNTQLANCPRSVLTIFYLAHNAIWDHTVVAVNLPWLHVLEARLNFLAVESDENNNNQVIGVQVFVGTLTSWQSRVEQLTGGMVVDYEWSRGVPSDSSVQNRLLEVEYDKAHGGVKRVMLGFHKPKTAQKVKN